MKSKLNTREEILSKYTAQIYLDERQRVFHMETFKDLVSRRHKPFRGYNGKQSETYSFLNAHTGIPPPVYKERVPIAP